MQFIVCIFGTKFFTFLEILLLKWGYARVSKSFEHKIQLCSSLSAPIPTGKRDSVHEIVVTRIPHMP